MADDAQPPSNSKADNPLRTPTGQRIDEGSFAKLQATPHALKQDAGENNNTESRQDVAQAMNSEMLLSDIDLFLSHYGPSPGITIDKPSIDACKAYLRGQGLLFKTGGAWVWKAFTLPPSKSGKTEQDAFQPFAKIVDSIWDFAKDVQGQKKHPYRFRMVPANHLESNIAGGDHRMDACVIEHSYVDKLINNNIVMPFELKTEWDTTDQIIVREQVVGDCHHILCDDPRRMFIYAVTIEDTRFTLWYFSRSHSVKAIAFDWLGNGMDTFIRVMLAFAYATPEGLGIDPHVFKAPRLHYEKEQRYVYEFKVPEGSVGPTVPLSLAAQTRARNTSEPEDGWTRVYYRTLQERIPARPLCISGRTTRIWEVIQVPSFWDSTPVKGAVPVILKDVWLEMGTPTEGENQARIFTMVDDFVARALASYPDPDGMMRFLNSEQRFKHFDDRTKMRLAGLLTNQAYRRLFLTKILEWKGQSSKVRHGDALRPTKPIFALPDIEGPDGNPGRTVMQEHPASLMAPQATSVPIQPPAVVAQRRYAPKSQVRFVYKEICTDIYCLPTFGALMDVTRQALDALQILYCVGWVHRDISIGNIMATPLATPDGQVSWEVKLSDLEFSQTLGHVAQRSDPRTGTPYFMPVEVMDRRYLALKLRNRKSPAPPPVVADTDTLASQLNVSVDHPDYAHYSQFHKLPFLSITELPSNAISWQIPTDYVKYNYQHDLESIWWIILYFVTACADCDTSEEYSKLIFLGTLRAAPRIQCLQSRIATKLIRVLHQRLRGTFSKPLETLRRILYEEYVKRTIFGQMGQHDSYSYVHAQFAEQLDKIMEGNRDNWKQLPIQQKDKPIGARFDSLPLDNLKRGLEDIEKPSSGNKKSKLT